MEIAQYVKTLCEEFLWDMGEFADSPLVEDYYSKAPMIFAGENAPRKFYGRIRFDGLFKQR